MDNQLSTSPSTSTSTMTLTTANTRGLRHKIVYPRPFPIWTIQSRRQDGRCSRRPEDFDNIDLGFRILTTAPNCSSAFFDNYFRSLMAQAPIKLIATDLLFQEKTKALEDIFLFKSDSLGGRLLEKNHQNLCFRTTPGIKGTITIVSNTIVINVVAITVFVTCPLSTSVRWLGFLTPISTTTTTTISMTISTTILILVFVTCPLSTSVRWFGFV